MTRQSEALERKYEAQRTHAKAVRVEMAKRWGEGASLAQLAREFGGSPGSARKALEVEGAIAPAVDRRMSKSEVDDLRRLAAEGASATAAAAVLGRPATTIIAAVRRLGIEIEPREGPTAQGWKGGRYTHRGYVMAWVSKKDAMSSMRDHSGRVPEHRLVMARMLGRPLQTHETVHHINGIRDDNRPSNLQLRQGRHGKGIAMRCRSCGSHDVEAAPLEHPQGDIS